MKLARLSDGTRSFWALQGPDGQTVREIAGSIVDWAPAVTRGGGEAALPLTGEARALDGLSFLAPVERGNRVVVAGANYRKHLAEFGVGETTQPIAFLKDYGALIGAHDPIRYPPLTQKLDHEVELVVVIGIAEIDLDNPFDSILGYTAGNDVSARDLQRSGPAGIGMDLFAGKSPDKSTPMGPWIVTRDEFPAGQPACRLHLTVNGETRQDANTDQMTWDVGELIKFVQQRSSFRPGDVMFTGSPDGVGDGTGRYLVSGDRVVTTVEGVGTLDNTVA
jgi:2-keto-4-pentenoate hydratase/2-oxohepta-3-ene-1,7-dioic acid hydratase in catechol pathway